MIERDYQHLPGVPSSDSPNLGDGRDRIRQIADNLLHGLNLDSEQSLGTDEIIKYDTLQTDHDHE